MYSWVRRPRTYRKSTCCLIVIQCHVNNMSKNNVLTKKRQRPVLSVAKSRSLGRRIRSTKVQFHSNSVVLLIPPSKNSQVMNISLYTVFTINNYYVHVIINNHYCHFTAVFVRTYAFTSLLLIVHRSICRTFHIYNMIHNQSVLTSLVHHRDLLRNVLECGS